MCSNCGQLGHGICKREIAEEERANIAEALRIRKEETKLAKQNNNRLRKAEKRKTLLKQVQEMDYRRSEHAKNLEKLRRQSRPERNFSSSEEDESECKATQEDSDENNKSEFASMLEIEKCEVVAIC